MIREKFILGGLILLILLVGMTAPAPAEEKAAEEKTAEEKTGTDGKVAVVNGAVITQEAFEQEMTPVLRQMEMQGQKPDESQVAEIRKKVLDNMINREVLYQASQKKNFTADDNAVEEKLASFKKQFPNEAQFKEALSKMNLSEEVIKKQIREQISIEQLVEKEVAPGITVSEADAKAYYEANPQFFKQPEQVKARHILIKVAPDADEAKKAEARKKLETVQKKMKEGGDFSDLAKEFSEGPSSATGGDLGSFGRGQMVKPFEEVAFALEEGMVSDIVETRFGYHLIKVEEKEPASTVSFADGKERIEQMLKRQKVSEAVNEYIENLKKDAEIEVYL
jgi:peptidyl-prolyl cis-trans isomerase C